MAVKVSLASISEAKEGAFCKLSKIFAFDFESEKGSHM